MRAEIVDDTYIIHPHHVITFSPTSRLSRRYYCCCTRVTVEMLSQGASKVNISLVVQMKDRERVIKALHKRFFEEPNRI